MAGLSLLALSREVKEEWRPVLRYEGIYEVSSFGRVHRIKGGRGATAGRVLRQKPPVVMEKMIGASA